MRLTIPFISMFLVAAATSYQVSLKAQDRAVAWVHGLGENAETWAIYRDLFNAERQINGRSNNHVDEQGVAVFANNVEAAMIANFPGTFGAGTTNIGIGHSLGGLALRELDRTRTGANRRLGGLITVGTPNNGGPIVTSIRNGDVARAANNACERLSAGPLSEIPIRNIVVQIAGLSISNNVICDIINREVLDPLFQAQGIGPSVDDVEPGNPFLATLNANLPNVPAISIRGNENSPVHWRLLSSFASNNMNDARFVEIAMLMRNIYNGLFVFHLSAATVTGIFGFFNPLAWIPAARHAWRATQWHKGKKWFDQSENIWNGLIGCTGETVFHTVTFTGNVCNGFTTGTPQWINCLYSQCGGLIEQCIQTITFSFVTFVNNSSDGLFCDQTQLIDGLPAENYYEARGVNHMEQTNTSFGTTADGGDEMRRIFNLIWNRTDPEFATPTR